jgi:hypothetical protein
VKRLPFVCDDGGRVAAGFASDNVGDCVCRSVAIASGRPYAEIYDALARGNEKQRRSKRTHPAHYGVRSASMGISQVVQGLYARPGVRVGADYAHRPRKWAHLRADELPMGRLVVEVSRHSTAVIDGVIHDKYDPSRNGKRCVCGYWRFTGAARRKPAEGVQAMKKKRTNARREVPKRVKTVTPPQPVRKIWGVPSWLWAVLLLFLIAQFALMLARH